MLRIVPLIFLIIFQSCIKQEAVDDVTSLPQKFVVDSIANKIVTEGSYVQIFNASNGLDSNLPITYSCYFDTSVDGAVLSTNACTTLSGVSFNSGNGHFYWSVDHTQGNSNPIYEFRITASDSEASDDELFTIKVLNLNQTPDLGPLAPINVTEGILYTYDFDDLSGGDTDADGDANIYFCNYKRDDTTIGSCSELGVSLNITTGVMSWTPNIHTSYTDKTLEFIIRVNDGVDVKEHPLTVQVTHVNQTPSITPISQIASNFIGNEIEIYQGRLFDGLDFYHSFTINGTFNLTHPSTNYYCFYDTLVDKKVVGLNSCSAIGITFDLEKQKFVYDSSVSVPVGQYEIKLIVADVSFQSETLFFKVSHPEELEDVDEDSNKLTYKCYYDEVMDGSVAIANNCSNINIILNEHTGKLTWIPPFKSTDKEYEVIIVASDGSITNSTIFVFKSVYTNRINFDSIAIGKEHQCAISNGNDLFCWGKNSQGELGAADTFERKVPVNISYLHSISTGFKKVSTMTSHTCGLNLKGEVYCFGDNSYGQVGIGTTSDVQVPTKVNTSAMNNEIIVDIAVASESTCLLNEIGSVYCFGKGDQGELGDSTSTSRTKPTNLAYFPPSVGGKVISLTAGSNFFCALIDNGDLYCWGDNTSGVFGKGTIISSSIPTKSNMNDVIKVKAKFDSICALDINYDLYCFGGNSQGELGVGTVNPIESTPLLVSNNVYDFDLGSNFMCYVDAGAGYNLMCSGSNADGQLGNNLATGNSNIPVLVDAHNNKRGVFAGLQRACSISSLGPSCWGIGTSHIYSDFSTATINSPNLINLNILNDDEVALVSVGIGDGFGCTINSVGHIYCFGDNTNSNLGMGQIDRAEKPTQVFPSGKTFYDFKVGKNSVCAKDQESNNPYCFGANSLGKIDFAGIGVNLDIPTLFAGSASTSISANGEHSCFIDENQELACSGTNGESQLGIGTISVSDDITSVDVTGLPSDKFKKVVTGEFHTCGLSSSGDIYCFGKGSDYQLGQGLTTNEMTPIGIDTSSLSNKKFIDLFANHSNTCAINSGHELVCWGDNSSGQLGTGSLTSEIKPKLVSTNHLQGKVYFKEIAIGESHICGLDLVGTLYCMGDNSFGQFGDSQTIDSYYLKKVSNNISANHYYQSISSFGNTVCVVNSDKKLYCWGENKLDIFGEASSQSLSTSPLLIEHN